MKLHWLDLLNFRQFADSHVEFLEGLIVVMGANGAGKSTLLEAIGFALYGEQRGDKATIPFLWAPEPTGRATTTRYAVGLQFELDGRTLWVERKVDTATFKDMTDGGDGITIATSLGGVTKAVEDRLGMNYDEFVNSFCARQNELAFMNFKSNAETQRKINKMLGYDRVQIAEDAARELLKLARTRVEALAAVIGDPKALTQDVADREKEYDDIAAAMTTNTAAGIAIETRRPGVEARAKQATEYADITTKIAGLAGRVETLTETKATADAELKAAQTDIERRAAISAEAGRYPAIEIELADIRKAKTEVARRTEITTAIATHRRNIIVATAKLGELVVPDVDAMRTEVAGIRDQIRVDDIALEKAAEQWRTTKSMATAALATANANHRNAIANKTTAEAKIAAGKCPTCGQDFPASMTDAIAELAAVVEQAAAAVAIAATEAETPEPAALQTARDAIKTANDQAKAIDDNITAALEVQRKRTLTETAIAGERSSIATLEAEAKGLAAAYDEKAEADAAGRLDALKPTYDEHRALAGADGRLQRAQTGVAKAIADLASANTNMDTLTAQRTELGFDSKEAAEAATTALATLNTDAATIAAEARGLVQRQTSTHAAMMSARQRVEESKEREAELKAAKSDVTLNEALAKELKALRVKLNASIIPELSARASEILAMLTGGRYTVMELDDKFNVSIIDDGVAKTIISGGEEDAKDIALRLALCGMIQERKGRPMSLLILDEIFGSLDVERRQAVCDALVGLKGMFEQIILISHIEGTAEIADHCIYLHRDPATHATVVADGPDDELVAA